MESQGRSAARDNSYVHTPLPKPREQIRVLKLCPAEAICAELRGRLTIKALRAVCTCYEALSYTWGVGATQEDLILDGQRLKIGLNLHDALRRLRRTNKSRSLWIDAVCINQCDNAEKTVQIAMMGEIYAKARQTVIWLGEEISRGDAEVITQFFARAAWLLWRRQSIAAVKSELGRLRSIMTNVLPAIVRPSQPASALSEMMRPNFWQGFLRLEDADFTSILQKLGQQNEMTVRAFLCRPWFGRRWIIQEVCRARGAVMMCGDHVLKWVAFERVMSGIQHSGVWQGDHLPAFNLSNAWWWVRQDIRLRHYDQHNSSQALSFKDAARELLQFLQMLDHFQCQDPRDAIAAILGLWRSLHGRIVVDYSLSVKENYQTFAQRMVESGLCLDILHSAVQRPRASEAAAESLPSWAPDWRLPVLSKWLNPPKWQPKHSFQRLEDNRLALIIRGIILERVQEVQPSEGYHLLNESGVYTSAGGHGWALNIDKKKLPRASNELPGPTGDSQLHLVRPADFVCSLAVDERFAQNKAIVISHGLFVLRENQELSKLQGSTAESKTYKLVATMDRFRPGDRLAVEQAFLNDEFHALTLI